MSILEDADLNAFKVHLNQNGEKRNDSNMKLKLPDVYKELRLRGYDYGKAFQGILESNSEGKLNLNGFKKILIKKVEVAMKSNGPQRCHRLAVVSSPCVGLG